MTEDSKELPQTPPVVITPTRKSKKTTYSLATDDEKIFFGGQETYKLNNDPVTNRIMGTMGYDKTKIGSFTEIYQNAERAQIHHHKLTSEKVGAYSDYEKQMAVAKEQFHYLCKVAKIVFRKNDEVLNSLQLKGKKDKSIKSLFADMNRFYQLALADRTILEALATHSYSEKTIRSFQEGYLQTHAAYNLLNVEIGQSLEATKIRDQKIAELDEWMYEYYSLSKIAYALNPNWLEE